MLSIKPSWIIAGVGALAVGLIITLAWRHYEGLVQANANLEAANAELALALEIEKDTVEVQQQAITEWQAAAVEWQKEQQRLARVAQQATAESRRLNGIFAEHDLTRLALAKPGLIERRINAGTDRAGRLLECASTPGGCESGDRNAEAN